MKEKGLHLPFLTSLHPRLTNAIWATTGRSNPTSTDMIPKSPRPHRDTHSPLAHGRGLDLEVPPQSIPDINP